jgi:hypothetical protein
MRVIVPYEISKVNSHVETKNLYSNIDMFNDIENTLLDNDLQVCLICDFNAHTGNVSEYVVIDNNILDVLNLQDQGRIHDFKLGGGNNNLSSIVNQKTQ